MSAITIGFLLILIGTIFVLNPDLPNNIVEFSRPESFELKAVSDSLNVSLPIPKDPSRYLLIYQTVESFCLVWAVFLLAMLGVRFIFRSPASNKAEALGNTAFWFGAAYFVQTLIVDTARAGTLGREEWFGFWAIVISLIGVSLIVRGFLLIFARKTQMT